MELLGEQFGLVVVPRPADVAVDLLQTDQVGILGLDDLDDPFEGVPAISAADAFVDVVAEDPHRSSDLAADRPAITAVNLGDTEELLPIQIEPFVDASQ
jgi:hypothetical protein